MDKDVPDSKKNNLIDNLRSIRGWLVIPLLYLVAVVPHEGYYLLVRLKPFVSAVSAGFWHSLTDPASEMYNLPLAVAVVFEIAGKLVLIVMGVMALVFVLKKSRVAPKLVIAWLAYLIVFNAVYPFLDRRLGNDPELLEFAVRESWAIVWAAYFLRSKRVKATFTR